MSRIESRGKKGHKDLMTKILEQRQCFNRLDDGIQAVKDQMSQGQGSLETRLDTMSNTANNLQTSVTSLRGLGSQILAFIGTFSAEIQILLRKIIHTDQQMYNLLLQVQQRISASPTTMLQSKIKFEDALGRARELPYEYFRHWEVSYLENFAFAVCRRILTCLALRRVSTSRIQEHPRREQGA